LWSDLSIAKASAGAALRRVLRVVRVLRVDELGRVDGMANAPDAG